MDKIESIGKNHRVIIIGFTGPIGSGCTTASKFLGYELFEDHSGFYNFLKEEGYIKNVESREIEKDRWTPHINKYFEARTRAEKQTVGSYQNITLTHLHNQIKELLEKREYLYPLQDFLDDDYYRSCLRISCSSIIIFEMMRQLDQDIEHQDPDKIVQIKEFIDLIKTSIGRHSIDANLFKEVYEEVKGHFEHKDFTENSKKDLKTDKIDNCFKNIAKIKSDISQSPTYRYFLQDFGDNLRHSGNPFKYPVGIDDLETFQDNNYIIGKFIDYIIHYYANSEKKINFYVIDSFKNPMTIKYLRYRYPRFFLISLFAQASKRKDRLIAKESKINNGSFNKLLFNKLFDEQDKRDQGGEIDKEYEMFHKQYVSETVLLSDIAINNETDDKHNLFSKLLRYIALIAQPGCTKPTEDEMFMNMAYSMAMKSNCISRQVGAVIKGRSGYLVGAGWNDVGQGQISCGLRNVQDLKLSEYKHYLKAILSKSNKNGLNEDDILKQIFESCANEHSCFCFKDEIAKQEISKETDQIPDKIVDQINLLKIKISEKQSDILIDKVSTILSGLKYKNLSYCKALHAEENAIIQGAKIGGMGLLDSTIYSTTFPCELCAKKIHQSGIKEVIYVEPYPKNISEDLYLQDGIRKVKTTQFEGVKAYAYFKLFKPFLDKKNLQELRQQGFIHNIK